MGNQSSKIDSLENKWVQPSAPSYLGRVEKERRKAVQLGLGEDLNLGPPEYTHTTLDARN